MAAFIMSDNTRVKIDKDGEDLIFIFPPWSDDMFNKGVEKLCADRYKVTGRGRAKDHSYAERDRFFLKYIIDIENVMLDKDETIPFNKDTPKEVLSKHFKGRTDWKSCVPYPMRVRVAQTFEDTSVEVREDNEED